MHTKLTLDRGEKLIVAETVQDVEPILDLNKELQTMEQKSDWGRHIATIPNVVLVQWLNEEWKRGNKTIKMYDEEFNKLVDRKLKDRDWLWLRTDK